MRAVEEVRGSVNAEEFGCIGNGFDEEKAVCGRWVRGDVNGEEIAGVRRGKGAFERED